MERNSKTSERIGGKHMLDLKIFFCIGNIILGKVEREDPDYILVEKPRVLQQMPTKDGVVNSLVPFLGEPEKVTLYKNQVGLQYDVKDHRLKDAYIKSVTGLVLATKIPTDPKLQ
jgi:hypothetical protein